MDTVRCVKVVYEDNGVSKVVKGYLLKDEEFTLTIRCIPQNNILTIGKRALVKIDEVST